MSQIDIAHELQVSKQSISSDVQHLRSQAKESIKEYVTEHAYEILKTFEDNREKLQAMELFKYTHLVKLELLSNATTIDSAKLYQKQAARTA
jgi:hypothetical protein